MIETNAGRGDPAGRAVASVFGVLSGLGGLTHGVGEVLQGSVAPQGIIINSWVQGPIATNMGGEPGMTIVPNLLITGILTILVSLAAIAWSVALVRRRRGGPLLIVLAVAMLLFGGGFGPPIIGMLAGAAAAGIGAPHTWWRTRPPAGIRRALAAAWPWVFALCTINGVFLTIGSVILVVVFGMNNPDLYVGSFLLSVVLLLVSVVTGAAYDAERVEGPHGVAVANRKRAV